MDVGRATRLALWPLGIGAGLVSVAVDRAGPSSAMAGLVAGWSVIATGLVLWTRRPAGRVGATLTAAAFAWLLAGWNTPVIGSSAGFAAGLVLSGLAPALLGHAALTFPAGRPTRVELLGLALAYAATAGALGLLPALVFDPATAGCGQCPGNPLRLVDAPGLYAGLNRAGLWLGLVWAPLLAGLLARRLARCTPGLRTVKAPLTLVTIVNLAMVTWDYQVSLGTGFLTTERRTAEAFAFIGASAAVNWTWSRARRTRTEMARLVVELAGSPQPGTLRDMLAAKLGDPGLHLAYPVADGGYVDADGRPLSRGIGRSVTPLVREGREVAVLTHRTGLFDDPALADEVVAGSWLALENERLQAELNAQLAELRASRARIVQAGDAERRRLERDLHDGAQQQFAALLLSTAVARLRSDDAALAAVEDELRAAADELQMLARGIFPAILAHEGLAAAVESLAEESRVRIVAVPTGRLDQAVEAAAYFAIARAVPEEGILIVTAVVDRDRLVITLEGAGTTAGLRDRIAALDGKLETGVDGRMRLELPCGS